MRFCVDYRKLNSVTVGHAHPLPRVDDILDSIYNMPKETLNIFPHTFYLFIYFYTLSSVTYQTNDR